MPSKELSIVYKSIIAKLDHLDEDEVNELLKNLESVNTRSPLDYEPHDKQRQFHTSEAKIRFLCGGNRSGKTEAGTLEACFHALGVYPDWYPESQKIKGASRGRIVVTDYSKGCGEVLEPKIVEWLPKERIIKIKRTIKGYIEKIYLRHSSGGTSTIDVMTYEQADGIFEGWSGHWAWFDEPPPRNKFIATLRGLIDFAGRAWLTLTPISEPWLYDDFIANADDDVFYISVDIRDNPYITEEEIKKFEARLTEDEKEARLHGKFRHLVGRVYKEFDPKVHILDAKQIKFDPRWPTYFVLDPHDRRPHVGIWAKIDPLGTIYIIQEIVFKGTIECTSKEILKRELLMRIPPLSVIRVLDPNKGRTPSNVTGLILKDEFAKHAVYFTTDVNDDVATGHLAVAEKLYYDKTKPLSTTNKPKLLFIREGTKFVVKQIQTYVWDDHKSSEKAKKEKPKDVNKDAPDCLRYLVMSNPTFFLPDEFDEPETESDSRTGYSL